MVDGTSYIARLIEELRSPDDEVQLRAENALIKIGKPAVDDLIEATRSPIAQVRWRAVYSLGNIGDHIAFQAIAHLLLDEDEYVCHEATEALGHLGDQRAIPLLAGIIRNAAEDEEKACHATHYVAMFGKDAVPYMSLVLADGTSAARCAAAYALGNTGATEAVDCLIQYLEYPDLRHDVAVALAKLGDDRAVDILVGYLQEGETEDNDDSVVWALKALEGSSVSTLVQLLATHIAKTPSVIIDILAWIGDSRAIDVLAEFADDPDLGYAALIASGKCGDKRVLPQLIAMLRNADENYDIGVAHALAVFGESVLDVLREAVESDNRYSKEMAASALAEIPVDESVDLLARMLYDQDDGLRQWAVESLSELGEARPDTLGERCLNSIESLLEHPDIRTYTHAASWSAGLRDKLKMPPNPKVADM